MPYIRRRGLGYTPKIGSDGTVIDCDQWSNLFQSVCWIPDWLAGKGQATLPTVTKTDPTTGQQSVVPVLPAPCDPGIDPTCGGGGPTSGMPWGTIAIVAVIAVLGISFIGGGSPRRYGR